MEQINELMQDVDANTLWGYVNEYGLKLLLALAIFVIGKWVAKAIRRLSRSAMTRGKVDETLSVFLGNIVYFLSMAFVIIAALSQLGVDTTSLAAIFAAAGLAVGLALQGSLSNFASGVLLIAFRPFKLGDVVEAAGVTGKVKDISIFTTTINTPDNKRIIVPNAAITGGTITNISAEETRRVDMVFGIGYDDDIDKARAVLEDIISGHALILRDPEPTITVLELADSSVNFAVRPWAKSDDYWAVYFDITEQVKKRFDAEGLSIPYPQQDVHMFPVENNLKQAA